MNYNNIRKDCLPQETIERIERILDRNGIKTYISEQKKASPQIYSVRIEFSNFKGLGTNGKGITKELAIASAYAELMERLQSGLLIRDSFLTKKKVKGFKLKGKWAQITSFLS